MSSKNYPYAELKPYVSGSRPIHNLKIPVATKSRLPTTPPPRHPFSIINNVKQQIVRLQRSDKKNAAEILTNIRRIRLRRCPSYIDIGATPSTGNFTKF